MGEKQSCWTVTRPVLRRRRLIVAGIAWFAAPHAVFAQQCRVTPRDALGPFYKSGAPLQTELCASGGGEKLLVTGRVLGMPGCKPLSGALVEVWQADARGDYTLFTPDRKSTRLNSSHIQKSRMPSSA